MRYSLSSRFQGTLLGAALGEILGTRCQVVPAKQPLLWSNVSHWGFSNSAAVEDSAIAKTGWGRVAVQLAKGLIQGGGSETSWVDEVLDVLGTPFSQVIDAGLAIATLPIALFFHADPDQLEQELQQADQWHDQPELSKGVLAVSYALSLALREQLDPTRLIDEIIEELELNRDRSSTHSPAQSEFVEQLQFVQTLSQVSFDSATVQLRHRFDRSQSVDTLPLAIAFHCFLSTPEDFRLSVIRAAQLHRHPQTTCLTAALSGAYNGVSSIPLSWRSALNREDAQHSSLNRLWGVTSEAELQHLSHQLLAAWSGAYDLVHLLKYPSQTFAIAAPQVIRP